MNPLIERKSKICIVSISLAKGGAERSTSTLTKILKDQGFDVHLVLLNDAIDFDFEGQLLNLGTDKTVADSPWKRFRRIKKLRRYLITENFEFVIDTRPRRSVPIEWIYLNYVYLNFKLICIVHNSKLEKYFTTNKWIAQMIIKKSSKIIGVSQTITENINFTYNTKKALTIYNSVTDLNQQQSEFSSQKPYILFLGRLDDNHKNFSLLIAAYKQSILADNDVQLYIVGDGPDKDLVQQEIDTNKLQDSVKLMSFTPNVYSILNDALYLVLTSRYEGFPMVLIEALSVGTPVISVNCRSGPSEIIHHEMNGLLVENHIPKALAQAFDRFLLDTDLYNTCKSNSKQSVSHLNQRIIGKQWSKILNP